MKCLETFFPDLNRKENLEKKKENTINQKASESVEASPPVSTSFFFREKNVSLVYFHSRLIRFPE